MRLEIAPQIDSVRVVGSAIDVPASQQGGSVSIISSQEIRQRNQALAIDLLRYVPGMAFSQTGATGRRGRPVHPRRISRISTWWRSMACR